MMILTWDAWTQAHSSPTARWPLGRCRQDTAATVWLFAGLESRRTDPPSAHWNSNPTRGVVIAKTCSASLLLSGGRREGTAGTLGVTSGLNSLKSQRAWNSSSLCATGGSNLNPSDALMLRCGVPSTAESASCKATICHRPACLASSSR